MGGAGAAGGMSASEGLRRDLLTPAPLITVLLHYDSPVPLITARWTRVTFGVQENI